MTWQLNPKILHLVPAELLLRREFHLGSTKDVHGRWEYFRDRGIAFTVLPHVKSPSLVIQALAQLELTAFTHVVIEKATYPKVLRYIRLHFPNLKIVVRAHNAELPHRLDYLAVAIRSRESVLRTLYNAFVFAARDLAVARYAHAVLAITESECRPYWHKLVGSDRTYLVPFFLCRNALPIPSPNEKAQTCLCFGASKFGAVIGDAIRSFIRVVKSEQSLLPHWQFIVSGQANPSQFPLAEGIPRFRFHHFSTPAAALHAARAIAILSNAGRGFKTKILEAIEGGCFVVCTEKLWSRLPPELHPFTKVVNPNREGEFARALRECESPFPPMKPNSALRKIAFSQLDKLFAREHHL